MNSFSSQFVGRIQILLSASTTLHPLTSHEIFRHLYPRKSLKLAAGKKLYANLKACLSAMAKNPYRHGVVHLAGLGYWHSKREIFHVSSVACWPTKKLSVERFEQEIEFAFERHAKPLDTKHLLELLSARGVVMRGKLSRAAELERRMEATGLYRKLPHGGWWHNTVGATVVGTAA